MLPLLPYVCSNLFAWFFLIQASVSPVRGFKLPQTELSSVNATSSSLLGETVTQATKRQRGSGSFTEQCSTCCKAISPEPRYGRGQEVVTSFWLTKHFKRLKSPSSADATVVGDAGKGAVNIKLLGTLNCSPCLETPNPEPETLNPKP